MTETTQTGFDWEARILSRAAGCGLELSTTTVKSLALHARAVLRANEELRLTAITDPDEFLERHLGEAFEGGEMLQPDVKGLLLDVGSGNGYPGLPLAAARPGLRLLLTEASARKAAFLRHVLSETGLERADVLEAHIQRAADLFDIEPIRVLTSRAMGGWAKILPRLAPALAEDGRLLVWAGDEMERIARRVAWRKLELRERKPLPGRDQSWIWCFRSA